MFTAVFTTAFDWPSSIQPVCLLTWGEAGGRRPFAELPEQSATESVGISALRPGSRAGKERFHSGGTGELRQSQELTLLRCSSHNHTLRRHLLVKLPKPSHALVPAINLNLKSRCPPARRIATAEGGPGARAQPPRRAAALLSVLGGTKFCRPIFLFSFLFTCA